MDALVGWCTTKSVPYHGDGFLSRYVPSSVDDVNNDPIQIAPLNEDLTSVIEFDLHRFRRPRGTGPIGVDDNRLPTPHPG